METLRLEVRSAADGELTLCLAGELDFASAALLQAELATAEASGAEPITIDLSELAFIDSTGIRLLLESAARCEEQPGRLRVTGVQGQVAQVLEISGLAGRLGLEPTA